MNGIIGGVHSGNPKQGGREGGSEGAMDHLLERDGVQNKPESRTCGPCHGA